MCPQPFVLEFKPCSILEIGGTLQKEHHLSCSQDEDVVLPAPGRAPCSAVGLQQGFFQLPSPGAALGVASVGLSQHKLGAFVTAGAFLSKGEA